MAAEIKFFMFEILDINSAVREVFATGYREQRHMLAAKISKRFG